MLMFALALMVQDAPLPPVSPGLCVAAANKLEPVLASVRATLQEEAQKARDGKSQYTPERVQRMLDLLEIDAGNTAKVKRRYGSATASASELATLDAMHSPDWANYVKACANA